MLAIQRKSLKHVLNILERFDNTVYSDVYKAMKDMDIGQADKQSILKSIVPSSADMGKSHQEVIAWLKEILEDIPEK
jgi:hypothetical protein